MMDLKDILTKLELPDEQITAIENAMSENKLYVTTEENAETRLAKFKDERDEAQAKVDELTKSSEELATYKSELEAKITELEEKGGSNEDSEAKIAELQSQLDEAKGDYTNLNKQQKLEAALRKAGAKDVDYVGYKLGGIDKVELDDEGNIANWDNTLSSIKEQMPKYFNDTQPIVEGASLKGDNNKNVTDPFVALSRKYEKDN
ncbi:phage scaffolding protein [Leuconostoc citreum]